MTREPFLRDADLTLWQGDALELLRELPDRSVHMCATSPPFWSLRDYNAEGQIGLEATIDEWVARLVDVFAEVKRVLRDDGSLWLELGDSFSDKQLVGQPWRVAFALQRAGWFLRSEIIWARLRPNPMPESVTDRPTKSHSTVFLLSKSPRYFYDADAIREAYAHPEANGITKKPLTGAQRGDRPGSGKWAGSLPWAGVPQSGPQVETLDGSAGESPRGPDGRRVTAVKGQENSEQHRDGERCPNPSGANARSVWTIQTEPTPFAHFATWPRKLVARMILAGTSERGCCPECGAPWVRQTNEAHDAEGRTTNGQKPRTTERRGFDVRMVKTTSTLGWSASCDHALEPVPCTVLDPFGGSGTTALVARRLGRKAVLIELSPDYCRLIAERTQQQSLLADTA